MIMMGDKKKSLATVIAASIGGPAKSEESSEITKSDDYDLLACAADVFKAIENKDVNMLKGAMQSFFQICDTLPHDEYKEEAE
jgi:hypothetical protein